jgi:hypothetical protein
MSDDYTVSRDYVDRLFIHVYCDLGQRFEAIKTGSEFRLYHQLNMARLCRQLLIDGSQGLFTQANRNYRLPIRFVVPTVGPAPEGLKPIPEAILPHCPNLDAFPPGYYLHPHNVDGFLGLSQMILAGTPVKNSDVIKYVANVYGGVHLSPSIKDEDERLIARFDNQWNVGQDGMALSMLNDIVATILRSLAPLRAAIEAHYAGA